MDDEKETKNSNSSAMLVLLNHGDRYTLIKALDDLKPKFVILYHTDICSVRILDVSWKFLIYEKIVFRCIMRWIWIKN